MASGRCSGAGGDWSYRAVLGCLGGGGDDDDAPDNAPAEVVREVFPVKPAELIQKLNLLRPVYQQTAAYGHFGRSGDAFTWEETDLVDAIRSQLS